MFRVLNGVIRMTRGDTGRFTINIRDKNGAPYELQSGDRVRFSVKKSVEDTACVIQKTGAQIVLAPFDTAQLAVGEYVYDVEMKLSNGDVNTIVPPSAFILESEVTND